MPKVTSVRYADVQRDHDPRPFVAVDKPHTVLLPDGEGGFDVQYCPNAEKLARRLQRLPMLEAFYLRHAAGDEYALQPDGTYTDWNDL